MSIVDGDEYLLYLLQFSTSIPLKALKAQATIMTLQYRPVRCNRSATKLPYSTLTATTKHALM